MLIRLSEDEVKEAVAAWIRGKYADVIFGSVEKEQVKLETTMGTAMTSRFNYAEIDLSKKPTPDSHGYIFTGQIRSGDSSAPPKPEPPRPELYTKGGGSTPLPKKKTDTELDPVFGD